MRGFPRPVRVSRNLIPPPPPPHSLTRKSLAKSLAAGGKKQDKPTNEPPQRQQEREHHHAHTYPPVCFPSLVMGWFLLNRGRFEEPARRHTSATASSSIFEGNIPSISSPRFRETCPKNFRCLKSRLRKTISSSVLPPSPLPTPPRLIPHPDLQKQTPATRTMSK